MIGGDQYEQFCSLDLEKLYLFELVVTGMKDIDLVKNEFKKMFRLKLKIDKKDHKDQLRYKELFGNKSQKFDKHEILTKIEVSNDGCIHFVETYFREWKDNQDPNDLVHLTKKDMQSYLIHCDIIKLKFDKKNRPMRPVVFVNKVQFSNCLLLLNQKFYDAQIEILSSLIKSEQHAQKDLPNILKNDSNIKTNRNKRAMYIEKRLDIVKTFAFDRHTPGQKIQDELILFVCCGRDIKYSSVKPDCDNIFEQLEFQIEDDAEICEILQTEDEDIFQFVIRDEDKRLIIICTWNIETKCEVSMFQTPIVGNDRPGKHVVKGLNQKMNYFMDTYFIYDLNTRYPSEQVPNICEGQFTGRKINNACKVYVDGSRSLSIQNESILTYPSNKMDLTYWTDMEKLEMRPDIVIQNTELVRFNQVFDDSTLFHYFVEKPEILEAICNKYLKVKSQGLLTKETEHIPLLIQRPDKNGMTALDIAISKHRSGSFRTMLMLLQEVSGDFCITREMLYFLPQLIFQSTFTNHQFFDHTIFQPSIMQELLQIKWPDDIDSIVFASNTSLISKKNIEKILVERDLIEEEYKMEGETEKKKIDHEDQPTQKYIKVKKIKQELKVESKNQVQNARVNIEALDFDWIFEVCEDGEANVTKILSILSRQEGSEIFSRKSIIILVQLLWQEYQPQIQHKIIIPYCIYIFTLMIYQTQIGKVFGNMELLEQIMHVAMLSSGLLIQFYFYQHWIRQFWEKFSKTGFFSIFTIMGILKIVQLVLSVFVTFQFIQNTYRNKPILQDNWKLQCYAVLCFLMWTRLYYLMRVYDDKAHFITLISEIVVDIKSFSIMLAIMMISFANFFYVVDSGDKASEYVGEYTSSELVNNLMEQYQIAIGNFNIDNYSNGENSIIIWIFFMLASFIIVVVFMNLLVGIMSNTLNKVTDVQAQSTYQENVLMMQEYYYLLDPQEIFKNMKYIIYVSKNQRINMSDADETNMIIKDFKSSLFQVMETNTGATIKQNIQVEKQMRIMMRQHININFQIDQLVGQVTTIEKQQDEEEDEEGLQ